MFLCYVLKTTKPLKGRNVRFVRPEVDLLEYTRALRLFRDGVEVYKEHIDRAPE